MSTETIEVAGGDPVDVDIRATEWGPLVSDVGDQQRELTEQAFNPATLPGQANEVAVALRWTALTPGRTADAILALNKASNFEEFRTAAAFFEVPSQNMLYADVDGHIGYQMPGKVPVRPGTNDGTVPVNGWEEANELVWLHPFQRAAVGVRPARAVHRGGQSGRRQTTTRGCSPRTPVTATAVSASSTSSKSRHHSRQNLRPT